MSPEDRRLQFETRRQFFSRCGLGLGKVALASLLTDGKIFAEPKAGHFPAKVKSVIYLFMAGAPSQFELYDYKPALQKYDNQPLPDSLLKGKRFAFMDTFTKEKPKLLGTKRAFKQYGQGGAWISELLPHIAGVSDDIAFLKGVAAENFNHGPAKCFINTGSTRFGRPSMGSWITYGLGTENQDLPGFITVCPTLSHGGVNAYSSAFLPAVYSATAIGNAGVSSDQAKIPFIVNAEGTPRDVQRIELDLIQQLNQNHLAAAGPDSTLESRISSFELAFRMQTTAPELQDLGGESESIQKLYGLDNPTTANFGRQCLMARRFAERGVRFVQVSHSYKWDQHGNLKADHAKNALEVDRPIAGLLIDLKSRGLLDDTLVLWGGEFGRTPVAQGDDGRDHNPQGYTMWLAGGGVRGGLVYGKTDDYGYYSVENKVHLHDLHATILYLLGLDHTKLTYRYAGRDFRLTDVSGEIVHEIFA